VTIFPPFLARGNKSSVEDYIAAIDYVIGIAGEDNIGSGRTSPKIRTTPFLSIFAVTKDMDGG
jgi:membrane dipeptidase